MNVLHKCDNRLCLNPKHLFLGTHRDNVKDMVSKGRQVKGERCPASKLTEAQVLEIKSRYRKVSRGHGNGASLAREFGVTKTAIGHIVRGTNWRYLG